MYEPHLFQQKAYDDIRARIDKLSPQSQAQWGKMDVAQMLAHVATALEAAMTNKKITQVFIGRIFGPLAKRQILTKGLSKNTPTAPSLKISDAKQFQQEKERVLRELERFFNGGEAGITEQPHEFFGRLTPNEWARLQYVHMDHHFKQFGV
jgi:Protein of unknown function (DUF1569)